MKTAFSTNENSIEDLIEPAFGRCRNSLIVDSDSGAVTVVPNPGAAAAGGAGVKAAEALVRLGVGKLITGSVGLNARPVLEAAGISIATGQSGKIRSHLPGSGSWPQEAQPRPAAVMSRGGKPLVASSGRNPAGYCFCRHCGYRTDDDSGVPCFKLKCPNCASSMERRFDPSARF